MEDEDFLAAVEADNANAPVEDQPVVETPPAPKQEEPAKEPAQAPTLEAPTLSEPATPTEPAVPTELTPKAQPDPGFVPISAILDEREKRQAAEAELNQIRQAQQAQAQQFQAPDRDEDPDAFEAWQQSQVNEQIRQTNLNWSQRIATIEHGKETVDAAYQWGVAKCDADPLFNAKVMASADPVGLVVSEFKKDQIVSQVTPQDFEQFQAWKAAQQTLQQQAAHPNGAAPPNPASPIPPRSLASAPSAGGINSQVIQSDAEMFEEVIPKG